MNKRSWTALSYVIFLVGITIATMTNTIPICISSSTPRVKVILEEDELGPENVTGEEFKIAMVVEEVTNLYGFDLQLKWNTTYLKYISHSVLVPWDTSKTPVPPSPYGGILRSPTIPVQNVVDEEDAISGALPGTLGFWAYASMVPAPAFDGNGTVVVITFKIKNQPVGDVTVDVNIDFVSTDLANEAGEPITHNRLGGHLILHGIIEDTTPPSIENIKQDPSTGIRPEDKVKVNATITDESGVKKATLSYTKDNITWTNITMDEIKEDIYNATIPEFPACTTVTYKIIAEDNVGNVITTEDMDLVCQYHVVPEFSEIAMIAILVMFTLLAATISGKKKITKGYRV